MTLALAWLLVGCNRQSDSSDLAGPADLAVSPIYDLLYPTQPESRRGWRSFFHDPQRRGRSDAVGPSIARERWRTQGHIAELLVGRDGTVFVDQSGVGAVALAAGDGRVLWSNPQSVFALAPDGTVYVGDSKGVSALDPTTGAGRWSIAIVGAGIVDDAGTLCLVGESAIHAIRADGSTAWTHEIDPHYAGSLSVGADGAVLYDNSGSRRVYSFERNDGSLRWSQVPIGHPMTRDDGVLLATSASSQDQLLEIDPTDGNVTASHVLSSGTNGWGWPAMAPDGSLRFAGSRDAFQTGGRLTAVSKEGKVVWTYDLVDEFTDGLPIVDGEGNTYFAVFDWQKRHAIYSIDPAGGLRWRFVVPDFNSRMALDEGVLYVDVLTGVLAIGG